MKTHVDFLDPISLTSGKLPLDSLLDNSVYYPASGYDVDLIRLFNKILTEKGVNSFVYCDYKSTIRGTARALFTTLSKNFHIIGPKKP